MSEVTTQQEWDVKDSKPDSKPCGKPVPHYHHYWIDGPKELVNGFCQGPMYRCNGK